MSADADPGEPWEGLEVELSIGDVAHGGHCVARAADGRVVFVRHTLPGERVRAVITEERPGFMRADTVAVLEASPDRVTPPCRWSGACGGCDFQHASLDAQRRLKSRVLAEQLRRLGGLDDAELAALDLTVRALPDVAGEPPGLGWRTRVQYTVDAQGQAGLLRHRSHEVVPIDTCLIAHPAVRAAPVLAPALWADEDGVEVVASAAGDDSAGDDSGGDDSGGDDSGGDDSARAGEVTLLRSGAFGQRIDGPSTVHERAVGRDWAIPAQAFWQVHPAAADTLARAVVELLAPRPSERAWDLYGGAGLFAAALAPHLGGTGRITLVEGDPHAVAAARQNLRDLTTVTVERGEVARVLTNPRWRSVDLVVLDPPRAGAGRRVVESIVERSPRAVVYVACDPAAFGRDVRTFTSAGWALREVRAFDLFPMTRHVEAVGLFTPSLASPE